MTDDANDDTDEAALPERTAQQDMELTPSEHDSSLNLDIGTLRVAPARVFEQALEQTRMAITITDPFQLDNPIVYANRAFVELTGYELDEVIGRNCRFLQGVETSPDSIRALRDTMADRDVRVTEILNYRKDGTPFWNALHIGPVFDDGGELTHFYGSQWDITEAVEKRTRLALQKTVAEELMHRTKNLFGVIGSILRITARGSTDVAEVVRKVESRINALGAAHAISIAGGDPVGGVADLHDLAASILKPYRSEAVERIHLSGPVVEIPSGAVTPIGLMLHELATNAVKYGAFSAAEGTVTVAWRREDDRLVLTWVEDGGPRVEKSDVQGSGSRITAGVLGAIGATIDYDWPPSGLTATMRVKL